MIREGHVICDVVSGTQTFPAIFPLQQYQEVYFECFILSKLYILLCHCVLEIIVEGF